MLKMPVQTRELIDPEVKYCNQGGLCSQIPINQTNYKKMYFSMTASIVCVGVKINVTTESCSR